MLSKNTFDLHRARRDTPGCERVLHFNNAGSSLPPRRVLDALIEHLRLEAEIGGYEAAEKKQAEIGGLYVSAARLLNCSPAELAVVENATRAWDMAFYSIPFRPGERILTHAASYASNYLAFLQVARRTGAVIEQIPSDERGQVSIPALAGMLDERVRLVAITHVPTNGGLVNPAAAVGELTRQAGVLYLLDACQSVGQMPVDVSAIGCDLLSTTSRKYLRGPRGVGLLYVNAAAPEFLEPVFVDLRAATWQARQEYTIRSDARRFENWESYVAGKLGLKAAVDYALDWGLDSIQARIEGLAGLLRSQLADLPGAQVLDLGENPCGLVSFALEGLEPEQIRRKLGKQAINVSTSTVYSTRLDMEARGLDGLVRASLHYYNSEQEIDRFCEAVDALRQSRAVQE